MLLDCLYSSDYAFDVLVAVGLGWTRAADEKKRPRRLLNLKSNYYQGKSWR